MVNDIDMFKLVEEVEKQKTQDIDAIFNDLDSVSNDEMISEENKNAKYSNSASSSSISTIIKPELPDNISAYNTRFEAFRILIESVSYGSDATSAYVVGHKDALGKYYKDAYDNSKDLYVTEARVNDEINKYSSHNQLYEKGYYDGLFYILKSLRRSKQLLMSKINSQIMNKF